MDRLRQILKRIDGHGYRAYKDLRGRYDLNGFTLHIDRVQGDPFAAPSQLRVEVDADEAGFRREELDPLSRRIAAEDFVTRAFGRAIRRLGGRRAGSGKSGRFEIVRCGQEILERTSCRLSKRGDVTCRFTLGLPAAGRRILGREAWVLLSELLPRLVQESLYRDALEDERFVRHLDVAEDQDVLRSQLRAQGLVAFLADGALLPRVSGASDEPAGGHVIPLEACEGLAVTLSAPHEGALRGLGVRQGITLIVGGGYHGKSTVLNALARCVYPHVPGDGRERCVTDPDTVVIRAEDGRSIAGTDIRDFIGDLPLGKTTERFSTQDASGSTSQAAAIVEAREAGASALLIDEDTAATNFMIRDRRMRRLVPDEKEPITPFIDRVRQLADNQISTILVIGGAGDYLDVADHVICMDEYRPQDATTRSREVARELPARDESIAPPPLHDVSCRVPLPVSLDPRKGRRPERVKAVRTRDILFGEQEIDVSLVEQLLDPAQARGIGDVLLYASHRLVDGRRTIAEILDAIDRHIDEEGLEAMLPTPAGDRARPRRHEVSAALNRLRTLEVR